MTARCGFLAMLAPGLALVGASTVRPLAAQVDVFAHAGFATSVSRLGTYLPSGTTADAGVGWRPGHAPLTLRLQAGYTRLRANRFALGRVAEGADVWSVLALAALDLPVHEAARLRPYVVAGGGMQRRGPIGGLGLDYTRPTATAGVGAEYRGNRIAFSGEWRIAVAGTRAGREAIMPVVLGVRVPVLSRAPPPTTRTEPEGSTTQDTFASRGTLASWVGYAPTTWSSAPLGGTSDRGLFLAGLRCTWLIAGSSDWRLDYAADVIPVAVMTRTVLLPERGTPTGRLSGEPRGAVYGIGAVPLGLNGQRRIAGTWWVTLGTGAGMVGFAHDVPLPGARKLNFLLTGSLGAEAGISGRLRLLGGVRLDHLSNANSAYYNPGANFVTFYLGVSRPR